jgi:hypothetical protein
VYTVLKSALVWCSIPCYITRKRKYIVALTIRSTEYSLHWLLRVCVRAHYGLQLLSACSSCGTPLAVYMHNFASMLRNQYAHTVVAHALRNHTVVRAGCAPKSGSVSETRVSALPGCRNCRNLPKLPKPQSLKQLLGTCLRLHIASPVHC